MISPAEEKDIEEMKRQVQKKKLDCYEYMRALSRMTPVELNQAGHRAGGPMAVFNTLQRTMTDIDKIVAAHIRKYPD